MKQFARGKYTGLMDADHVMTDPRTIEILIGFLEEYPAVDAVTVDSKKVNKKFNAQCGHVVLGVS